MPQHKKIDSLKIICTENIIKSLYTFWVPKESNLREVIEKIYSNKNTNIRYFIGPFDRLDDQTVEYIIKALYERKGPAFNGCYLLIFLQYRIKKIDFSFMMGKSLIINHALTNYIGRNCINVVDLNLCGQKNLKPNWINYMIQSMRNLQKLNLSYTQSNIDTIRVLAQHCRKLEHLTMENCIGLYDDCLAIIVEKFPKIESLNVDYIKFSDEIVKKVLVECKQLKFFYVNKLLQILAQLWQEGYEKKLVLNRLDVDSGVILSKDKMQALAQLCPNLRQLSLNCIGNSEHFFYFHQFNLLSNLLLANTSALNSFKFGGKLLEVLRDGLGKQLRALHLCHFDDINLRSIAKHCPNLIKLNVEFLGYYDPALDTSLNESDISSIKTLTDLSVSNVSVKFEQIYMNIDQFRIDLTGLIGNGRLKNLFMARINELDDDFFQFVFLAIEPASNGSWINSKLAYESLEKIEFTEMNSISSNLISNYLINRTNNLQELNLIKCKQIGNNHFKETKRTILLKNLDCKVKWT